MRYQIIILLVLLLVVYGYSEEITPAHNLLALLSPEKRVPSYLLSLFSAEKNGTGWQYRKKILSDYLSYGTSEKLAIRDLNEKIDLIAPEKGAMFLHMLKNLVGEEIFNNVLEEFISEDRFIDASWKDIEDAFKKVSSEDISWFFSQWLMRDEIPSIEVKNLRVLIKNGFPSVSFEILQKGEPFKFFIPVRIITEKKEKREIIQIEEKKKIFEIQVEERPLKIIFDEDYEIMRKLKNQEITPLLSNFFRTNNKIVIFSEEEKEKYSPLINIFEENGYSVKEEKEIKDEDIRSSS
ncbi:MAG: M1 family aminopeptidase, partial [Thermodesulfovibrionales bacterium]